MFKSKIHFYLYNCITLKTLAHYFVISFQVFRPMIRSSGGLAKEAIEVLPRIRVCPASMREAATPLRLMRYYND